MARAPRANLPFAVIRQATFPTAPDPFLPTLALRHAFVGSATVDCRGGLAVMFKLAYELVVGPMTASKPGAGPVLVGSSWPARLVAGSPRKHLTGANDPNGRAGAEREPHCAGAPDSSQSA